MPNKLKAKDLLTKDFMKNFEILTLAEKAKVIEELEEKFGGKDVGSSSRNLSANDHETEGGADAWE